MVLSHADVSLPGVRPLVLRRTHVSSYRVGRSLGPSWAFTVDQRVELDGLGDPLGRRIAKEQRAEDGTVVERVDFVWDGPVLAEQATAGRDTVWDWQPGTFRAVSQTERSSVDEQFYAIVTDIVGTPTEMVGDDGAVAWRSRPTVWGARPRRPAAG